MSQIYLKRCDRCGGISDLANTPQPLGWVTLADMGAGTLASFDLCASCQEAMGVQEMFRDRLRANAVGNLKALFRPDHLPELSASLHFEEIVGKIEAGDFDAAFAEGSGIDLPGTIDEIETALADDEVVDAELVS